MKTTTMKTEALGGPALDWAVAQAIGLQVIFHVFSETVDTSTNERPSSIQITLGADVYYHSGDMSLALYSPSTDWSQCGPLVESFGVGLSKAIGEEEGGWWAEHPAIVGCIGGDAPLVAICRAVVAAWIGDAIEVPTELEGSHQ